jgi:hypothetical protein
MVHRHFGASFGVPTNCHVGARGASLGVPSGESSAMISNCETSVNQEVGVRSVDVDGASVPVDGAAILKEMR